MMIVNSTKYCACGVGAAISAFGKRKVDNNEVIIFKNAIELERFVDVDINKEFDSEYIEKIESDATVRFEK